VNGFQGARYKGFQTRDEAQAFIDYGYKMINNGKPTESSRRATAIQALAKQQPEEPEQRIVMTGLAIVEEDSDDLPKLKQTKLTGTSSRGSVTDLRLTVSFDGGSRGNPGVAGAGASVISFDGSNRRTINIRKYVGDQETNNFAEYWGVVIGLRTALREVEHLKASWTQRRDPCVNLIVQGDSKLVINQLLGVWKVKKPELQPLWRKARQQQLEIERITQCTTSLEHVYREFNSVADGKYCRTPPILAFSLVSRTSKCCYG